jgi:hypothetical protein
VSPVCAVTAPRAVCVHSQGPSPLRSTALDYLLHLSHNQRHPAHCYFPPSPLCSETSWRPRGGASCTASPPARTGRLQTPPLQVWGMRSAWTPSTGGVAGLSTEWHSGALLPANFTRQNAAFGTGGWVGYRIEGSPAPGGAYGRPAGAAVGCAEPCVRIPSFLPSKDEERRAGADSVTGGDDQSR